MSELDFVLAVPLVMMMVMWLVSHVMAMHAEQRALTDQIKSIYEGQRRAKEQHAAYRAALSANRDGEPQQHDGT